MKKRRLLIRTIILSVLIATLGYTLYTNFFTDKEKVKEGSVAPDFVLTDLDGKKHQLSDLKGKGVFLNFWGTWCEPCKREMPYMANQYKNYQELGVEILAINVGESNLTVSNFIKQYNLNFPVVMDKDSQVLNAYGVKPLPTTFLINKDGKVVKIITGSMTEKMVRDYMELIKP
ncbi:thiol-disulfide oxidoreductase ResA [Priestia endophytica]|uniref:Thiol-disulfide oxidoreductase ResA n=1 Tax=Priestia endophytica DSM 13796 TaxID=1121089 RepID=A0A1I6BV42_9BACI|nr:thiol-disulfide oxidoreductase ResA [Priestia endophytica]KYG30802.1 thiol-disulfide oxidoreductase [Priestia endophytica]MBG9811106.1 thiol-disulfide oxidoreductase [Priestia endophytica]SFQ84771.1 Peroxiredoxin [Priestia endophytica DSM 13796]